MGGRGDRVNDLENYCDNIFATRSHLANGVAARNICARFSAWFKTIEVLQPSLCARIKGVMCIVCARGVHLNI